MCVTPSALLLHVRRIENSRKCSFLPQSKTLRRTGRDGDVAARPELLRVGLCHPAEAPGVRRDPVLRVGRALAVPRVRVELVVPDVLAAVARHCSFRFNITTGESTKATRAFLSWPADRPAGGWATPEESTTSYRSAKGSSSEACGTAYYPHQRRDKIYSLLAVTKLTTGSCEKNSKEMKHLPDVHSLPCEK